MTLAEASVGWLDKEAAGENCGGLSPV